MLASLTGFTLKALRVIAVGTSVARRSERRGLRGLRGKADDRYSG
ncbi:hypothetical protein [Phenylobacterium sp.]|nr:hypothetical protein [Phenylobacterium sp.]